MDKDAPETELALSDMNECIVRTVQTKQYLDGSTPVYGYDDF